MLLTCASMFIASSRVQPRFHAVGFALTVTSPIWILETAGQRCERSDWNTSSCVLSSFYFSLLLTSHPLMLTTRLPVVSLALFTYVDYTPSRGLSVFVYRCWLHTFPWSLCLCLRMLAVLVWNSHSVDTHPHISESVVHSLWLSLWQIHCA